MTNFLGAQAGVFTAAIADALSMPPETVTLLSVSQGFAPGGRRLLARLLGRRPLAVAPLTIQVFVDGNDPTSLYQTAQEAIKCAGWRGGLRVAAAPGLPFACKHLYKHSCGPTSAPCAPHHSRASP